LSCHKTKNQGVHTPDRTLRQLAVCPMTADHNRTQREQRPTLSMQVGRESRWSVTSAEIARVEVVVAIVSPMLISGVAYPELG
jgi:hypothetical protein